MEFGLVRPVLAGVTQPTPTVPEPVQTASKPDLDRARAVESAGASERAAVRRERAVALNTLPAGEGIDVPPSATASDEAPRSAAAPVQSPDLQRRFDIDDTSKQVVFRMIDVSTGEVVRQLPQENRLRLQEMLRAFGSIPPAGRTQAFDGSF